MIEKILDRIKSQILWIQHIIIIDDKETVLHADFKQHVDLTKLGKSILNAKKNLTETFAALNISKKKFIKMRFELEGIQFILIPMGQGYYLGLVTNQPEPQLIDLNSIDKELSDLLELLKKTEID